MDNRPSSHSIHNLQVHLVCITKYRYSVLTGDIQLRCRELIKQTCNALDVQILKGVVSKDHIHLHLSYPPKLSIIGFYCLQNYNKKTTPQRKNTKK